MKKAAAFAMMLVMAASLTACFENSFPLPVMGTPLPAEAQVMNTEAPKDEPASEPTAAPAAEPRPTFAPYNLATGKLTEGPMLPDGAEYLVIKGESDIYYVYNGEGVLTDAFHATDFDLWYCMDGIFGPKGVTCRRLIATGEEIGELNYLGDIIFTTVGWYRENGEGYDYGKYIKDVYNSDLELMCSFDEGAAEIGEIGGIIHVDGKLLVLERDYDWENGGMVCKSTPKLFSEDGRYLGTLDPTPFGAVCGVFGGKYLVCYFGENHDDTMDFSAPVYTLCTLEGEAVMNNIGMIAANSYCAEDEIWYGCLVGAKYVVNAEGEAFDISFAHIEAPEDPWSLYGESAKPYRAMYDEDFVYVSGSVYAGVKDAEGNWLFRIYNPGNASDSDNSEGDRFWRIYHQSSSLQYYWWE